MFGRSVSEFKPESGSRVRGRVGGLMGGVGGGAPTQAPLARIGDVAASEVAHEGVAGVEHVLAHNERRLRGVAARHGPHEKGVFRVRGLHAMFLAELRSPERQQAYPELKRLLDQEGVMRGVIDGLVEA